MRLYTASKFTPASACLSLAKSDGNFDDIIKVTTDGKTTMKNELSISGNLVIDGDSKWNIKAQNKQINITPWSTTTSSWDNSNQISITTSGLINCNGFGGKSNLVSIYSGIATGKCGSETQVTHNLNYKNPSKLVIQLTPVKGKNNASAGNSDNGSIFWINIQSDSNGNPTIGSNSFTFYTRQHNGNAACNDVPNGGTTQTPVHYTIFEYY